MKYTTSFVSGRSRKRGFARPGVAPVIGAIAGPDVHTVGLPSTATILSRSGTEPISVAYQWQTSVDGSNWSNIVGATSQTSPVWLEVDAGFYKRCRITLTNVGGSTVGYTSGAAIPGGGTVTDIGNWTTPVPVTAVGATEADRMANTQVGTRFAFIDPVSGINPTAGTWANTGLYGNGGGEYYFWNGTNIIDSQGNTSPGGVGVLYGTDPFTPGASVKPFKSWSFVAPRGNGSAPGSAASYGNLEFTVAGMTSGRNAKPDWWLFKRGTTIDMTADQAEVPGATGGTLAVSAGAGPSALAVVGAYGTGQRPKFKRPISNFLWRWLDGVPFTDVLYLSLWFDGTDRTANADPGIVLMYQGASTQNLVLEDVVMDGGRGIVYQLCTGSTLKLRRCIVTDNYSTTSHNQGIFTSNDINSRLQVEDCIFARNGFSDDPKVMWPQTPVNENIYNRNFYLSGNCDHLNSWLDNTVSLYGASGDQPGRCGGLRVRKNFFLAGYVSMEGKDTTERGSCGEMTSNVQQVFYRPNGNVFGSMSASYQIGGVTFSDNIITLEGVPVENRGSMSGPISISAATAGGGRSKDSLLGTRNNVFTNNIFWYSGKAVLANISAGIQSAESYPPNTDDLDLQRTTWVESATTYTFQGPGTFGNSITNNKFIGSAAPAVNRTKYRGATAPFNEWVDDTVISGNTYYATEAEAITAESFPDARRTFKKYLETLGHAPANEDEDAVRLYIEYVLLNIRKGQWDYRYTARAIVNYFREGFNKTAV